MLRRSLILVSALACACALAGQAFGSQLIDRNASQISLKVNRQGVALLNYKAHGSWHHVLAWGAINARVAPAGDTPSRPQVKLRLDYAGGWGKYRKVVWPSFKNACRPYDGPQLAWFVTACKAPDGSYWAVQAWQTDLPDLGFVPWTTKQSAWHLDLAHWTGPLAKVEAYTDWIYGGRYHDLFGRLTYKGQPVHGYHTTRYGAPLDGYGRLIYLDTLNSAYGSGWRRENSFVAHKRHGNFCYGFYRFNPMTGGYAHPPGYRGGLRPEGNGSKYRITVIGPGVTPDIAWLGNGLPNYDARNPALVSLEQQMNALNHTLAGDDQLCRQN